MASFGHSGSHISQFMHFLVINNAIGKSQKLHKQGGYYTPDFCSDQFFHQRLALADALRGVLQILLYQRHKQQVGE